MAATTVDKTKPYFPIAGATHDGWSTEEEATATCFCGAVQLSFTCGTLLYRVGGAFPGLTIRKTGTVDDFALHETKLKPTLEQFTRDRPAWLAPTEGAKQFVLDGLQQ